MCLDHELDLAGVAMYVEHEVCLGREGLRVITVRTHLIPTNLNVHAHANASIHLAMENDSHFSIHLIILRHCFCSCKAENHLNCPNKLPKQSTDALR